MKYSFTHNSDNNLTSRFYEEWDGSNWKPKDKYFSFFDSSKNMFYFYSSEINIFYRTITDVPKTKGIVLDYSLSQNYPNPFNPSTVINFSIPESGLVTLKVFNILGQEVVELVNDVKSAGTYEVSFDASGLTTGMYVYKIQSGNYTATKKMMLIK
ncbi:MAG: T9SS type A sorting domain-containing protein [Melioribacteraceae bacterium]|nr:T9SS type A sorting domain-containing protein [Melioribacteraceae bacterium]